MEAELKEAVVKYKENPTHRDNIRSTSDASRYMNAELSGDCTLSAYKLDKFIGDFKFEGGYIDIKRDQIAANIGVSERTVYNAIEQLVKHSLLFRSNKVRKYWINLLVYDK